MKSAGRTFTASTLQPTTGSSRSSALAEVCAVSLPSRLYVSSNGFLALISLLLLLHHMGVT